MKVNLTKIFATRKTKLIGLSLLILIVAGSGFYWFYLRDTTQGASKEFLAESATISDAMKSSEIISGIDPSRIREIDASIQAKDYKGAKKLIDAILAEPNLPDISKGSIYTQLAHVCLPLKDFACVDKVAAEYGKSLQIDNYFLVDSARLAKQLRQNDLSKKYYKLAFDDIEKRGGQAFVDSSNKEGTDTALNYAEIKQGAGM